jgi:hypothetical protein
MKGERGSGRSHENLAKRPSLRITVLLLMNNDTPSEHPSPNLNGRQESQLPPLPFMLRGVCPSMILEFPPQPLL